MSDKKLLRFTLNGKPAEVQADPGMRMLDVLRNVLNLTGTKEGCAVGECGACTVVMDGEAVTSCIVLAGQMDGADILTIEGLSEEEMGKVLQACFIEEGAIQCGFCTPGMLMSAWALLKKNPKPTRQQVKVAISGNLCRCTGYVPIVNAIEKAAAQLGK